MASKKKPAPPMTPGQLDRFRKNAALERQRRGLPTFTRSEVREKVLGSTAAENTLQRYQRRSQAGR